MLFESFLEAVFVEFKTTKKNSNNKEVFFPIFVTLKILTTSVNTIYSDSNKNNIFFINKHKNTILHSKKIVMS